MDPEAPRNLGDLEESEPERRSPGRPNPSKKSLEEFLLEFEARLRDHPGEVATSAMAAVEGRADGTWRTPVEGGARTGRRLPRRPPWRHPEPEAAALPPAPPIEAVDEPLDAPPPPEPAAALPPPDAAEESNSAPASDTASGGKRRQRHRRRHRHR